MGRMRQSLMQPSYQNCAPLVSSQTCHPQSRPSSLPPPSTCLGPGRVQAAVGDAVQPGRQALQRSVLTALPVAQVEHLPLHKVHTHQVEARVGLTERAGFVGAERGGITERRVGTHQHAAFSRAWCRSQAAGRPLEHPSGTSPAPLKRPHRRFPQPKGSDASPPPAHLAVQPLQKRLGGLLSGHKGNRKGAARRRALPLRTPHLDRQGRGARRGSGSALFLRFFRRCCAGVAVVFAVINVACLAAWNTRPAVHDVVTLAGQAHPAVPPGSW